MKTTFAQLSKRKKKHCVATSSKPLGEKRLDIVVDIIAILMPISILEQVYNVWWLKHVEGVPLVMWGFWTLASVVLFYYGKVHKDIRLMIMYGLYFVVEALVVIGVLIN